MAENEKHCGNFLKGFVIGSFLGALAGIFFAPKPAKSKGGH
ncbi:MAG: YtxH domain-containing protein [Deltaproteobacteria bacterium]